MKKVKKDVHTEHCCIFHGCKYSDDNCTVITEKLPQSYPCESCSDKHKQLLKSDSPLRKGYILSISACSFFRTKKDYEKQNREKGLYVQAKKPFVIDKYGKVVKAFWASVEAEKFSLMTDFLFK